MIRSELAEAAPALKNEIHMNICFELGKETAEKVAHAAAREGRDVPSFLEEFVTRSFSGETGPRRSLAEILAPFRAEVEQSGLTDQELDTLFSGARSRASADRNQRRE